MTTVTAHAAKTNLSKLPARVEAREVAVEHGQDAGALRAHRRDPFDAYGVVRLW